MITDWCTWFLLCKSSCKLSTKVIYLLRISSTTSMCWTLHKGWPMIIIKPSGQLYWWPAVLTMLRSNKEIKKIPWVTLVEKILSLFFWKEKIFMRGSLTVTTIWSRENTALRNIAEIFMRNSRDAYSRRKFSAYYFESNAPAKYRTLKFSFVQQKFYGKTHPTNYMPLKIVSCLVGFMIFIWILRKESRRLFITSVDGIP